MFNRSYIIDHKTHPHYFPDYKISQLRDKTVLDKEEERLLRVFKSLSDPTKFKIYTVLQNVEEISVSDLSLILGVSQPAISHALSDLKTLDIVEAHRCGQLICYSLKRQKEKIKFVDYFKNLIVGR